MSPSNPLPGKHPLWWLGQSLLVAALWLTFIKLPGVPSVSLDSSWQMVLGYAAERDLQHGVDLVFTYGPLGYLLSSTYMGGHFAAFLCWQIVSNLLIALALHRFGRELPGWRRAPYYAYLFFFGSLYADAMQMNVIAIFSLMLLRPGCRQRVWLAAVGTTFAIFALMKFTNLLLCVFSLAVLVAYSLSIRARREAAWLAGTFALVFAVLWLVLGQSLAALPQFLYYGLQVSTGYVEAMAVYEQPVVLAAGLGALGAIIAYALLFLIRATDRRAALAVCLVLGAVIFMNWKHGFVRADGHVLAHFIMCLLVVCSYPALTGDSRDWGWAKGAALGIAGACCLAGITLVSPGAVTHAAGNWNARLLEAASALGNPGDFRRTLDASVQELAQRINQPNLRLIMAGATVDHLGSDQAYTILNRFNYTPRPAVQGYAAYTEALNRLDERFYLSDRAPRFVVQRFTTIDGRFPTLDDSLTLRLLLQNYDYNLEEGGLLLWERPAQPPVADEGTVLLRRTLRFGEKLAVPDTGDRPVWATIKVRPTIVGTLRKFFYKAPLLYLETADQAGVTGRYQLIRSMAATGFILNPFFQTGDDLIAFQNGRFQRRLTTFAVQAMPGGESFFSPEIEVELRTLAPFKQAMVDTNRNLRNSFRMMNRRPVVVDSWIPMTSVILEGKEVLMVHANGRVEFELDPSTRSVRGRFGMLPGSERKETASDGVDFIIELKLPSGESRLLFRRFLDPVQNTGDRKPHEFVIDLPADAAGRVVLHTRGGPRDNESFDWAYWTDIEFR